MAIPNPQTEGASITPVEPAVAQIEPERFARASEVADRFVDPAVAGARFVIRLPSA